MNISMYDITVPALLRGLNITAQYLEKMEADATARKIDVSIFINARLAPDMHNLGYQIQRVSDTAKNAVGRLGAAEAPSFPDTETTLAEFKQRIANTIAFLNTIKPEQLEGSDTKTVEIKTRLGEMKFVGKDYVLKFVLPNLYFHMTTLHAILRHNGVNIGKADYLGSL